MQALVIDTQAHSRELLTALLQRHKYKVVSVDDPVRALEYLRSTQFDIIFTEKELLHETTAEVIFLTEKRDYEALETLLKKPLFIAESPAMKEILETVKKVALSQANIFITGESGTGKEGIASLIHYYSTRKTQSFIKVNCAAIPETLLESEFFGHEKGAFTGAHSKRLGRFELAHQGTLLLDEISEIPLFLQAKLLRAIQEQEFERVGGSEPIKVNVRFISTSNRSLAKAIENHSFREDLFYRLNVIPIELPPLRDRKEDMLPLAHHFLSTSCEKNNLPPKRFSDEALEKLFNHSWPGNIRELANTVEQGVILSESDTVNLLIHRKKHIEMPDQLTLKELEAAYIQQTLALYNNNKTHAAKALGISVRTLRNKLQ